MGGGVSQSGRAGGAAAGRGGAHAGTLRRDEEEQEEDAGAAAARHETMEMLPVLKNPAPAVVPAVMLDGHDLTRTETATEDETRRAELERLRLALQNSDLNRPRHPYAHQAADDDRQDSPEARKTSDSTPSPEHAKSGAQPRKRRVQWIGLEDESHDHSTHVANAQQNLHPGHVSVSVPSTPVEEVDGFPWASNADGASDGTRTPGGGLTPDSGSRPGSPEAHIDIPAGEQDGLPLPSSKRGRTFTREAAKLVAMHKAKNAFLARRSGHARSSAEGSPTRSAPAKKSASAQAAREALFNEAPSTSTSQAAPSGTGVLSTLLKLYEQPGSAYSSQATLVASRPASPDVPHPIDASQNRPNTSGSVSHQAPARLDTPSSFSDNARVRSNPHLGNLFKDVADRWQDYREDRPAAAKSHGGVFGALQASTFNLTGVATPTASTVAPAAKRPGFRVDRHSSPEVPTTSSLSRPSTPGSGTATPISPSPGYITPPVQRRAGSHLNLSALGKLPIDLARTSEKLAKENLDPKKYYRESAVLKAAKASGSVPSSPKNEYVDDKANRTVRRKKDKRRQEEIFITMHVAAILQRQDFVLRLARALVMFGAPAHRIEYQLQQTAKVLDIHCQIIFIVNFMIISFSDVDTHTSEIKFIKQAPGLDLNRLNELAILHWEVMHDKIGVEEASVEISNLMRAKPHWSNWTLVAFGAACSTCIGIAAFNASFIDLLVSAALGALLVAVQVFIAARSDILSSVFEIIITTIISFVAAALASTQLFCYAAITSSSIVLILPGWPVCTAALELQSRSLVSGSVRLIYAVVYSLFLGFGISTGAQIWTLVSGSDGVYASTNNTCEASHDPSLWYRATLPQWFFFLGVPMFPLFLSLRNFAVLKRKETVVGVLIAAAGWNANRWSGIYGFPARSDISSAIGAFTATLLGTLWGKYFQGQGFLVTLPAIMFQLPSGLGNGGLLNWSSVSSDTAAVVGSGWNVAQQLISVAIGLVIGCSVAVAVVYPLGKRKGGLNSF